MALLALDDLHLSFGGVAALNGVSIEVEPHDFFAIIGPNGAGKTSIFNCISGIYAPTRGRIRFDGRDVTRLAPHQRAQLRIARTFQNIALFRGMTVLDNVKMGRHIHLRAGLLACGDVEVAIQLAGGPASAQHLVKICSTPSGLSVVSTVFR